MLLLVRVSKEKGRGESAARVVVLVVLVCLMTTAATTLGMA